MEAGVIYVLADLTYPRACETLGDADLVLLSALLGRECGGNDSPVETVDVDLALIRVQLELRDWPPAVGDPSGCWVMKRTYLARSSGPVGPVADARVVPQATRSRARLTAVARRVTDAVLM
jgi:hypothetical protein